MSPSAQGLQILQDNAPKAHDQCQCATPDVCILDCGDVICAVCGGDTAFPGLEISRKYAPRHPLLVQLNDLAAVVTLEQYKREDMKHDAEMYQEELDNEERDRQSEISFARYGH